MVKIGEFNFGINQGDKVDLFFDKKLSTFFFQGKLPNNHVWLKAMRMYTAMQKAGFNQQLQNASTFATNYAFEIHVHTYYINKIIPQLLKFPLPNMKEVNKEYGDAKEIVEAELNRRRLAASDTQSSNLGKAYAADYEETKRDYEALMKEWQEITQKYQKEVQELNRLATHANAVIFTISLSSDVKVVPDNAANVTLAMSECYNELQMRCGTVVRDAGLQNFELRTVMQPYFFFFSEIAGMFNPVIVASMAQDPYFFELYKGMFPHINAASVLQSNLENMKHLTSTALSDILRRMLLQMEYATPNMPMPQQQVTQQGAQTEQEQFKREDYLTDGVLIGTDRMGGEVRLPFRTLDKHIMVEGVTMSGKSQFAKLLATEAIKYAGMKVIVFDITWGWTRLVKLHDGVIFDKKIDVAEALKHDFSLCIIEEYNLASAEQDFLKPFYDYILKERLKIEQEGKDILLIIDETHKFSKKSKSGELVNLATQIAKYGVVLMFVTQRSEQLNIHARSQTTLQFIALTQDDYYRAKADIHSKEWSRAMQNIKKYNLFVHGAEIQFAFEVKPLRFDKYSKISKEEFEHYRYKGFDAAKVEPKPEQTQINAEQKPHISEQTAPSVEQKHEKQQPAPQVLTNVSEVTISSWEKKIEPPVVEKQNGLNDRERKIIAILQKHGGVCESSNKLFGAIGMKTGESTLDIEKSLQEKGFIVVEKQGRTKKVIRLTEKGKAK